MGLITNSLPNKFQVSGGAHVSRFLKQQESKQRLRENFNSFGQYVSFPLGYQAVSKALLPSLKETSQIAAIISGEGEFDNLSVSVIVSLTAEIVGEGTLEPDAEVGKTLGAELVGSGTLLADARILASMSATVDAGARPSAFDIAQEVWQGQKASYNTPGTMGNAVNSAGSSGDPWSTDLDSGSYPPGTAGYYLKQMSAEELANAIMTDPRFLTVAKFLGLK